MFVKDLEVKIGGIKNKYKNQIKISIKNVLNNSFSEKTNSDID